MTAQGGRGESAVMESAPTSIERARERLREFFLLERAQRTSERRSAAQRDTIRTHYDAARRRIRAADDLRGPIQTPCALLLYQEAAFLYAIAFLSSRDATLDPSAVTPGEALAQLEHTLTSDGLGPPAQLAEARALIVTTDPLALDSIAPDSAARRVEESAAVARWLGRLVDPRSPGEIKAARNARWLAGAALVAAIAASAGVRAFAPKNLALHRPATASSFHANTAAAGAVDGSRTGAFGFHSQLEDAPWLSIDLGQPFAITRIVTYGRTDGPYDQSIPLVIEISDDGIVYRSIATRTTPFSDYEPWEVKPATPYVARHVRLRTLRRSYLVLGEVEVYGKRPSQP